MEKEIKVWWPYNVTFDCYHDMPLAGKRAEQFIQRNNEYMGGRWVLHTYEQHMEWYNRKQRFLDNLPYIYGDVYRPSRRDVSMLSCDSFAPQFYDLSY